MSARSVGSGYADESARGIEELFCALATGDTSWERAALRVLRDEYARGWCGIEPRTIHRWISQLVAKLHLPVRGGVTQPLNGLGDIELTLARGKVWVELKAQTKKERFRDIVQVDWVRDSTDALTWLFRNDLSFARRIPPWARPAIEARQAQLSGWGYDDLVVADLALLVNERLKAAAGVSNSADLKRFIARKYLLHVTREGARFIRLSDLEPMAAWASGKLATYVLKRNKETAVAVQVAVGRVPRHGVTEFTYHVAYRKQNALGRHKLHAVSASHSRATIVVPGG